MKNKVFLWIGIFFLSLGLSLPVLADSEGNAGSNTTIPVQVANPSPSQVASPTALPSDMTKITPPTPANTSINTETTPQPVIPSPVTVETPATNMPPTGSAPNMMDPTGAIGGASGAAEPVLSNYSPRWFLSPWFISLLVLILVIVLLVVYSLLEGKTPKEEKEAELSTPNKKKKAKK